MLVVRPRQKRVGVHVHDRVTVDVGHPGARCDFGRDLVHVPGGRDARADVDDLPNARLADQENVRRTARTPG